MNRGFVHPQHGMLFVKATDEHMRGFGDFQFELGRTYKHTNALVRCCGAGFHCCDTLEQIAACCAGTYSPDGHNRYFIVKAWGYYDVDTDANYTKYAFQCMQFIGELQYKTLAQVKQSMADINVTFHGPKRRLNLRQFDELQARFPSCLKLRVLGTPEADWGKSLAPSSAASRAVLEDLNRCDLAILMNYCGHGYVPCLPSDLDVPDGEHQTLALPAAESDTECRMYDVYHWAHEPALGLCLQAAREYVKGLEESP